MGFTSHSTDTPASQHYDAAITKIPTFHREMNVALSGRATAGFGSLIVSNTASPSTGAGVRDDWLRMKWKRDYVRLYLGDPSWHKSDFRPILVGRLGQPVAISVDQIEFPVGDLADFFNEPLQTNKFTSGPNINRAKPLAIGAPAWCDLMVIDQDALTFQMTDGPLEDDASERGYHWLYDDGRLMVTPLAEVVADPGADTISLLGSPTPEHGFGNGYVFVFFGSAPAGLSASTRYYGVNATTTTIQLSATPGGSAADITGSGTFDVDVFPYQIDYATGVVTLQTQPDSSRITAKRVLQESDVAGFDLAAARIQNMLAWTMFEQGGIPAEFKDEDSFDALGDDLHAQHTAGVYVRGADPPLIGDAVEAITNGSNTWYGVAPEGLIQVGLLKLPESTAVATFTESQVKQGSLRCTNVKRPVDFTKSVVTVAPPWLEHGPLLISGEGDPVGYAAEKIRLSTVTYGAASIPLDNHPELADSGIVKSFDLIYIDQGPTERNRMAGLYRQPLATFEFQLPLRGMCRDDGTMLCIGDTIQLTHRRLGWKTWNAGDPASPDNTADIDSTKAVVVGIDVDLSAKDPFPVKLTVFRQIPGYYPEEDLN